MAKIEIDEDLVRKLQAQIKAAGKEVDPAADVSRFAEWVRNKFRMLPLAVIAIGLFVAMKYLTVDPEIKTAIFKLAGIPLAAAVGYWIFRLVVKIRPHELEEMAYRLEANRIRAMYMVGAMLAYALL